MRCLVETIRAVAEAGRGATLSEGQQQLLQDSLQLLRDIAGLDDDGRGLASVSLVEEATSAGLVQLLLCMLKALGPISNPQSSAAAGPSPQPAAANGGSKISSLAAGIDVAELAPELRSGSAGLPLRPPYRGYRADVLSGERPSRPGNPRCLSSSSHRNGCVLADHSPLSCLPRRSACQPVVRAGGGEGGGAGGGRR